jgi:hypothetical protein
MDDLNKPWPCSSSIWCATACAPSGAAHAADFADAAHLTRTFHQMFGIPPSVMMRGEFFEIASPFAAPG